jgi:hypothetical protein
MGNLYDSNTQRESIEKQGLVNQLVNIYQTSGAQHHDKFVKGKSQQKQFSNMSAERYNA